jgi:hypothetical protein
MRLPRRYISRSGQFDPGRVAKGTALMQSLSMCPPITAPQKDFIDFSVLAGGPSR